MRPVKLSLEPASAEALRRKVVRVYKPWLLEEAVGVYKCSAGMSSNEMHSPIMCIAHGIPAIVNRWVEQSSKIRMWDDIGLDEWQFNFDVEEEVEAFPKAVLEMAKHPARAKSKALRARQFTARRFTETMAVLRQEIEKARSATE